MDIIKARQELMLGKTIYDMNLRVVDYGRVSTDKDDQLNSLENQINYFSDLIGSVKTWTHIRSYSDEGISGTQVYRREQFLQMIEDARLGKFDIILTKEVSRFARNTIDSISYTQQLLKYGVVVLFISDNINTIYPDSEFRLTLMASMAQDEVRKLSERVKFGVKRSIKDGKLGGGGIYGYSKKDGVLTIIEKEAEAVRMLFDLYITGEYGFAKIGEILASRGYYTRKGKVFADTTLKKMLNNPRYKGFYTANLTEVEDYKTHKKVPKPESEWIIYKDTTGKIPPIVSEEIWDRANKLYKQRNSHWAKTVLNKEFYLENRTYTSKIFCTEHNTTFIRTANCKRKDNPVWQCNEYLRHGIKGCLTPILYEKHLNDIFFNLLSKFVDNSDEILETILNDYKLLIKESDSTNDLESIKERITEQQAFKDRLLDMSLRNMISDDDFKTKNQKLDDEIRTLKTKLIKMESNRESPLYYENIVNQIKEFISPKMNIKENLSRYFNTFVDKVFVSKINNDRKHIKLEVLFNFNNPNEIIEIDTNNYNNPNNKGSNADEEIKIANGALTLKTNRKYNINLDFEGNFLRSKYLLQATKEPRICKFGIKTW